MSITIGPGNQDWWHVEQILTGRGIDPAKAKLGVEISPKKPQRTDRQNDGFHVLIDAWLEMGGITARAELHEQLAHSVCMDLWGSIDTELPDGSVHRKPLKTTTRVWSAEKDRYVRNVRTPEEMSELIEFTYMRAAERGVELPELTRAA